MKVLTVVFGLGMGGTERTAANYSRAYRRRGLAVRVVVTDELGRRAAALRAEGIQVDLIAPGRNGSGLAELRAWSPDLVHIHSHGIDKRFVAALREAFPQALFVETNVFATPQDYRGQLDVSGQLSAWCEWTYRCRSHDDSVPPRVAILPNLVDDSEFFPDPAARERFRTRHGLPENAFVYCRVGQPHEANWSPEILDLFHAVLREVPEAWLLLVGAAPSVIQRVESLEAGTRARVLRLASDADDARLREVYNGADVFVHIASGGESFGMVLAEAMLCECPPITLATPAFHNSQGEVVGNGDGGLVCTTTQGFLQAMLTLRRDAALRQLLARNGRQRVLQRFSADAILPRLLEPGAAGSHGANPSLGSLVRTCQNLCIDVWDRPNRVARHWLWLRYPLCAIRARSIGDRAWRAGMKAILALSRS